MPHTHSHTLTFAQAPTNMYTNTHLFVKGTPSDDDCSQRETCRTDDRDETDLRLMTMITRVLQSTLQEAEKCLSTMLP
jgi:hypothetical protein